jgi:hypothetical protein
MPMMPRRGHRVQGPGKRPAAGKPVIAKGPTVQVPKLEEGPGWLYSDGAALPSLRPGSKHHMSKSKLQAVGLASRKLS